MNINSKINTNTGTESSQANQENKSQEKINAETGKVKILECNQKECIISKTHQIATGVFGPCYVFTGHDANSGYSFLAHIDDTTETKSIYNIFHTLKTSCHIQNLNTVKFSLMGGWNDHEESNHWGKQIKEILEQEKVLNFTDLTLFQKKNQSSNQAHYFGGIMAPKTGKFRFFKQPWNKLTKLQEKSTNQDLETLFSNMTVRDLFKKLNFQLQVSDEEFYNHFSLNNKFDNLFEMSIKELFEKINIQINNQTLIKITCEQLLHKIGINISASNIPFIGVALNGYEKPLSIKIID